MSLGLNTLKGGTTESIQVDSFIKKIKTTIEATKQNNIKNNPIIKNTNIGLKTDPIANIKKDISPETQAIASVHSLMHTPNIGNKVNAVLNCLAENPPTLEDLKEGVEGIKDEAVAAVSGIKAMAQDAANEAVDAFNSVKAEAKSDYQKVANLTNIDITAKDVGNFVEGMGVALAATGTALLLNKINKVSDKYTKCDNVPKNLSNNIGSKNTHTDATAAVNALTQAALSQSVKNMDCSGGSGMTALGHMSNGGCSSGGVGVSSTAKVMKLSSNAIDVSTKSLVSVASNNKFTKLVNKTFDTGKTIKKVLANDNGSDTHNTGSTIVNVFGSSSITHLKKEVVSGRHVSRTHKRRKENAYINGIVEAVKIAL